jgi:hypothetical protein
MNNESTTSSARYAPPAIVGDDFQSAIKDLTGMCGAEVDDLGKVMRANLFTDSEALAAMLIGAAQAMSRALNKLAADSHEEQPAELFNYAGRMLERANSEFRTNCKTRADVLRSQTPPKLCTPNARRVVPLRSGAKYSITSDTRNDGTVTVVIDGNLSELAVGASMEFNGGSVVEVHSTDLQLLSFSRVGGQLYIGDMKDIVCVPLLLKCKPRKLPEPIVAPVTEPIVAPMQMMSTPPKRSWFSFRK